MLASRAVVVLTLAFPVAAQCSLPTTLAAGNGQAGNMFDIVATTPVTVTAFDTHLEPGVWDVRVYTVTAGGSWQGLEEDATAWSLVGASPAVASNGAGALTPIPFAIDVPIAAGATQGFYITCANGTGVRYSNGSQVGAVVASDGAIQVLEGCGKTHAFGFTFDERIWNGAVHYTGGACASATSYGAGCSAGIVPLTLAPDGLPVVGGALSMTATFVPGSASVGITALGLQQQNVPIAGAPLGCVSLLVIVTSSPLNLATGKSSYLVPNAPAVAGVEFFAQAVVADGTLPAPLPILTSNGLRLVVGL